MSNELMPVNPFLPEGESDAELLAAQIKLWELLGRQVKSYTMGDSSSVRVETAQELLSSVCFTLGVELDGNPQTLKRLLAPGLDSRLADGVTAIEKKIETGKRLWQAACLSAPKIENLSLRDTLRSIGGFWRRYDHRYFAHQIPCDIDYQLCRPVPETVLGIDYINEYLHRILIEHDFLGRFDSKACIRLLEAYCPDYRGLLINLYEPVATNAVGLAMLGGDIRGLDIAQSQRARIAAILRPLPKARSIEALQSAASAACSALEIREPRARLYARKLAAALYPRIEAALPAGNLDGIFLTVTKRAYPREEWGR